MINEYEDGAEMGFRAIRKRFSYVPYIYLFNCNSDEVIVNPCYGDDFNLFQATNSSGRGRKCDLVNSHLA